MTYYRRRDMTDAEWALAGALGAAVGAVTFYLVSVWLQRETLPEGPPEPVGPEDEPEAKLEPADPAHERQAREADVAPDVEGAERPLQ
ncbi:MAG: hypothetical protein P8Y10_08480 [Gemmatimonadales bacterium]